MKPSERIRLRSELFHVYFSTPISRRVRARWVMSGDAWEGVCQAMPGYKGNDDHRVLLGRPVRLDPAADKIRLDDCE